MQTQEVDILIIGAGPAGCVAASYLAQKGLQVKVVEKSNFPRFAIGESLLPKCMEHFEKAGLLNCLKSQKYQVKKGARFIKGEAVCHFHFNENYTPGWEWTWQVPRADFDFQLTQELAKKGVDICFNSSFEEVSFTAQFSECKIRNEANSLQNIRAKKIIDASGNGRVIAKTLHLETASSNPGFGSIFTHVYDTNRPEGEEGSLISFDILETEVWVWVIPFSNGITSIGCVAPNAYFLKENNLFEIFKKSDYFSSRFSQTKPLFDPIQIKNYSVAVKKMYGNGFVLTGNSGTFLDPVFSSGVTFATESALLAAQLIEKEFKGENVDWEKDYEHYLKKGISVFESYVKEWYTGNLQTLFFHKPENPHIKKQICSVLAGYVWDNNNPFVAKHKSIIQSMAHFLNMNK